MTKSLTALALVLSLGSVAHAADAPVFTEDGTDESQQQLAPPANGSGDVRINAPRNTQTDVRTNKTVGPRSTKIGPAATNGPVIVTTNPTINVTIQNTRQNQTVEDITGSLAPIAPPVRAVPVPVCRPGVIGNLGGDPLGLGRPVFANVRAAPTADSPNVPGPDGAPVILPPGARVAVCGGGGMWALVEVCLPAPFPGQRPACVRGFTYSRFVIGI